MMVALDLREAGDQLAQDHRGLEDAKMQQHPPGDIVTTLAAGARVVHQHDLQKKVPARSDVKLANVLCEPRSRTCIRPETGWSTLAYAQRSLERGRSPVYHVDRPLVR